MDHEICLKKSSNMISSDFKNEGNYSLFSNFPLNTTFMYDLLQVQMMGL